MQVAQDGVQVADVAQRHHVVGTLDQHGLQHAERCGPGARRRQRPGAGCGAEERSSMRGAVQRVCGSRNCNARSRAGARTPLHVTLPTDVDGALDHRIALAVQESPRARRRSNEQQQPKKHSEKPPHAANEKD